MLAENQLIESTKITGLSVRRSRSGERMNRLEILTREIMPTDCDHVPTFEMTRRWSYLKKLEAEISVKLHFSEEPTCPKSSIYIPSIRQMNPSDSDLFWDRE